MLLPPPLKLDMHVPQLNNKMWWKFRRQWEHCEKASRLSVEEKKERTAILKAGEDAADIINTRLRLFKS